MADTLADIRPWAKINRDCIENKGSRCRKTCRCPVISSLSLIGHSADVAAVMQALLTNPVIAGRLARLLDRPALSSADRAKLSALAALHDLGKINHGFQGRPFVAGLAGGHIAPLVSLLHSARATAEQRRLRDDGGLKRFAHLFSNLADPGIPRHAILAHHGSLPGPCEPDLAIWQARPEYDPMTACLGLVSATAAWFEEALDPAPLPWTPQLQHAYAGLLMLADWLGSDTEFFKMPGKNVPDGPARFTWSAAVAQTLFSKRALAPVAARTAAVGLPWQCQTLTGHPAASFAQDAMLALPPAGPGGRTCLIEDETGSGKTEAALIHFLALFRQGLVDSLYFALPTRAAAVQIHARIKAALRALLRDAAPPVILAVPGYLGQRLTDASLPDEEQPWDKEDAKQDADWSSQRPKRYMASWVAVGTIDQALLGGLQVRHAQLRSAAMLRSLLVVDEVHASDPYMTVILRNLLAQHRRAGGHALLMSATLGSAARADLLTPHGRTSPAPFHEAAAAPYPAIWTDAAREPLARPHLARRQKPVHVELDPGWNQPAAIATRAVAAARNGARVLVIRNTVNAVIATQAALEAAAPDLSLTVAGVMCPHHARYAPEDRVRLDAALGCALGKDSAGRGCVTITSQTAEQSLDIDADFLVTDLCPADVLLQRLGRLHRHARPRPAGFGEAKAIVLAPSEAELLACINPKGEVTTAPLALGLVYPDLIGILATRRAVASGGAFRIPNDNRHLVERATHPEALRAMAEELGGPALAHWGARLGQVGAQTNAARGACLDWNKPITPLAGLNQKISTRLGLLDRTVELPPGTPGPFGSPITLLSVPGWLLRDVAADVQPVIRTEGNTIAIAFRDRLLSYDRLGLRRQ